MFADGHLLTQLIPEAENFENFVILLTWIRIDHILWIRIHITDSKVVCKYDCNCLQISHLALAQITGFLQYWFDPCEPSASRQPRIIPVYLKQ